MAASEAISKYGIRTLVFTATVPLAWRLCLATAAECERISASQVDVDGWTEKDDPTVCTHKESEWSAVCVQRVCGGG